MLLSEKKILIIYDLMTKDASSKIQIVLEILENIKKTKLK